MPDSFNDEEVWVRFRPRFVEVDGSSSDSLVRGLLRKVRSFLDMTEPPAGRKGCPECAICDTYISMLQETEQPDPKFAAIDRREYDRQVARWNHDQLTGKPNVRAALLRAFQHSAVNPDGVLANWGWEIAE